MAMLSRQRRFCLTESVEAIRCPSLRCDLPFRSPVPKRRWQNARKRSLRLLASRLADADLQTWLESSFQDSKRLEMVWKEDRAILLAKEGFEVGSSVFSLNQNQWISLETVSSSKIGPLVRELQPWLQLTLFILYEKFDPQSPWEAFLGQLPLQLNSPAFWKEEELKIIQGTQLHESATSYRQFFQQKYSNLESGLFSEHSELFSKEAFSLEAFLWAVGIVRSHIHPPLEEERSALVPFVSNISHKRKGNVELKVDTGNLFNRSSRLSAIAIQNIEPGSAIEMDFGPDKSDSRIALDYGFFDEDFAKGGYRLSLQLPESDAFYDDKIDILDMCGLKEPLIVNFVPNESPPEELLLFLRLLNTSGPDAFHLEAVFRNESLDHFSFPISEENESNLCDTMISGCDEALQPYQSIKILPDDSPKISLMKKVCYGEQRTLEWIRFWFQERKENLIELDYYAERRLQRLGLLDDEGQSTFEDMLDGGIA